MQVISAMEVQSVSGGVMAASCASGEFIKEGLAGAIVGGSVSWWTGSGIIAGAAIGGAAGIVGQSVKCAYDTWWM
jgi:hypothetical protein